MTVHETTQYFFTHVWLTIIKRQDIKSLTGYGLKGQTVPCSCVIYNSIVFLRRLKTPGHGSAMHTGNPTHSSSSSHTPVFTVACQRKQGREPTREATFTSIKI